MAGLGLRVVTAALATALALAHAGCQRTVGPAGEQTARPTERLRVDPHSVPDAVPKHERRSPQGNPEWYERNGQRYYVLPTAAGYVQRGIATYYEPDFQGQPTASGEIYDMHQMTAAHRTLPLPSYVRVTEPASGRSVVVRINDRGPFRDDRLIGLSTVAAAKLGILDQGPAAVEVRTVLPEPSGGSAVIRPAPKPPTVTQPLATPKPRSAGRPGTPPPPQGGPGTAAGYLVQAGAFRIEANAARLRSRLDQAAITPVRVAPGATPDGTIFRVQVGPHPTRQEAERTAAALRAAGVADPRILAAQ
jgi:rare lipoprotein A